MELAFKRCNFNFHLIVIHLIKMILNPLIELP